jgi:hypothetical protein
MNTKIVKKNKPKPNIVFIIEGEDQNKIIAEAIAAENKLKKKKTICEGCGDIIDIKGKYWCSRGDKFWCSECDPDDEI